MTASFSSGVPADAPKMPALDYTPPPYRGPSKAEVFAARKKHQNPVQQLLYGDNPVLFASGYMQYAFDETNRRYLDLFGGIVTVGVGHAHPRVVKAADEQMKRVSHTCSLYLNDQTAMYAKELAERLPAHLSSVYVVNSGSEANDLAALLARLYTKNDTMMSMRNGYHGMSGTSMGLTQHGNWKHNVSAPANMITTAAPNMYRGQFRLSDGLTPEQCSAKYVADVAEVLAHSVSADGMAAFVGEPIHGVGGTVDLPPGYLQEVYKLIRAAGGLCISDEVQTGFGRTGTHYWGFERAGVSPDIVVMAKSIGNGAPLAAVATTPEIAASLTRASYFNTYGGNPVSSAIGREVLRIIEDEDIQRNCLERGEQYLAGMRELQAKYPTNLGEVRGAGLMLGLELVTDPESKDPNVKLCTDTVNRARDYGILLGKGGLLGNVWRVKPPMCVTKEDADFSLEVFDRILKDCGAH